MTVDAFASEKLGPEFEGLSLLRGIMFQGSMLVLLCLLQADRAIWLGLAYIFP